MNDDIDSLERFMNGFWVGNAAVDETVMRRILGDIDKIRRVAGVGERIKVGDDVVRVGAPPITNEVTADKPGASGNKNMHKAR